MLETQDLTIRFGGHVAVDRVSCTFKPGTLTAIVGPNGAGKTTYFNLISGQLAASAGSVRLNGVDITTEGASVRALRRSPRSALSWTRSCAARAIRRAASASGSRR